MLSGNRNFEGRIHPLTQANYLASPPLVIAYALAGTVLIDFEKEPLGEENTLTIDLSFTLIDHWVDNVIRVHNSTSLLHREWRVARGLIHPLT